MAEIIPIKGGPDPRGPVPELIEDLEELLERAKSGELRAIAYALVTEATLSTGWTGSAGTRWTLYAAAGILHQRYLDALCRAEE